MLRCPACGYEIAQAAFDALCFADGVGGKDHYIDRLEDAECPECGKGALEEVS